jgi:AcrR family transcriptional regulator
MQEKSASENARTPERRSAIGSRLRANRTMRHLTLRELARRVGVSPSLIS